MAKNINRRLNIYINGKEVKNTLNAVGREMRKVRGQLNNMTEGTVEFEKKSKTLAFVEKRYEKMRKEQRGFVDALKSGNKVAKGSYKQLQGSVDRLNNELKQLSPNSDKFVNKSKKLRQVEAQLDEVKKAMKGVNAETSKATKKSESLSGGFLRAFVITESLIRVKQFVVNFAKDAIRLAEEARGVEYAFRQIDGSVELLQRTRKETQGLISDLEIKKAANSFNAFKLSLEPFPELLRFVATRAAQTGGNFDNMLNSLVEGLSKESKLRIDNLGISQKQLNAELEKTPNFVQAVANIAKRELGPAGAILDEAADANQRWNVALENAKLRVGKLMQRSGITSFFQKIGTSMLNSLAPIHDFNQLFKTQVEKMILVEKTLIPLKDEYEELKNKASKSADEQKRLKDVIQGIGEIAPGAITAFDEYGNAIDVSVDSVNTFIEKQKALMQFRNQDAIKEQKDQLGDYNDQIANTEETLKSFETSIGIYEKTLLEGKANDYTVKKLEKLKKLHGEASTTLAGLKEVVIAGNEDLDKLTGDYIEKYIAAQKKKTADTLAEARKQADAFKLPYSPENTAAEINAMITAYEATSAERKRQAEKDEAERLRILLRQKRFRNKVLFDSKTVFEQEKILHKERLQDAGIFGIAKEKLTEKQLAVFEALEAKHKANMAKLDVKATQDYFAKQAQINDQKIQGIKTQQQKELASITTLEEAKKVLSRTLFGDQLDEITTFKEAKKALEKQYQLEELEQQQAFLTEMVLNLEAALKGEAVDGISLSDNILSEEERVVLEERIGSINLLMAELGVKKKDLAGIDEDGEKTAPDIDVLGFNPAQWEATFENKEKLVGKLQRTAMVLNTVGQAWNTYSQFAAAAEQRQLQTLEKSSAKKKKLLNDELKRYQKQLDNKTISEDAFKAHKERIGNSIQKIDETVAKKKAEIDYKRAKREKVSSLFSIAAHTASAIAQALPNIPLTIIVGAIGAIQAGLVLAQPLPDKSYAEGGFTTGLGFRDQDAEVAGVVHANEYVVPRAVLTSNDPAVPAVIEYLEAKRKGNTTSFVEGGETSENTEILSDVDTEDEMPMTQIVQAVTRLNAILDNGISTGPVFIGDRDIEDLQERKDELDDVRNNAKIQ